MQSVGPIRWLPRLLNPWIINYCREIKPLNNVVLWRDRRELNRCGLSFDGGDVQGSAVRMDLSRIWLLFAL
jgi:hypothetical protein